MPIVTWIPPGDSVPPLRVSRVANLGHNQLNRISRKFDWVACPAGVEPATYGLEGLANLQNTMPDKDLQLVDLSCSSKQGWSWRWMGSDIEALVSAGVCRENQQIQAPF